MRNSQLLIFGQLEIDKVEELYQFPTESENAFYLLGIIIKFLIQVLNSFQDSAKKGNMKISIELLEVKLTVLIPLYSTWSLPSYSTWSHN